MANATPQDVPAPAPKLTPEQRRKNALAYEKQEKEKKAKAKQPEGHNVPGTNTYHVDEPIKYAKGGSVRGGGCEQRGKTKGKMV